MNWGHKIAIVYTSFALLIVTMVVLCAKQTDIFLVSQDYYKEEINYQQRIDNEGNAQRAAMQISQQTDQIELVWNKGAADGVVWLFRPADANQDLKLPLVLYKKQAADFRNMAHKYKRNFGRDERQQRKLLFDEAYRLLQEVQKTEDYIISNLVEKTQVVACTPVGSTHKSLENQQFDWVFIDEAAQALEPMSWIPIQKAERVILAGDHHQLPPTIKSENAAIRKALTQTLFEKAIAKHPQASSLLSIQYRMNEQIMGFSSQYFYGNKLVAAPQVAQSQLVFAEKEHTWNEPIWLVDTAGCSFDEKNIADRSGIFNPEEATLVQKLWQQLRDEWPKNQPLSVGIISPYRAQVEYLKEIFEADKNIPAYIHLAVNTIDGFQGQERDVIFISLVRSNARQEIGFLSDYRRMNVAMTRARKKLVIIGDSATFAADNFYAQILKYAEDKDAYKSAWEYL